MSIAENIIEIRRRIEHAAHRAGRDPNQIQLMAVSKTHPANLIREAYGAGLRLFGENRVQEFATKVDPLRDLQDAEFHLIGHLQSNKATKAAELFSSIDSVDSLRLAQKLDAAAKEKNIKLQVLIEVNVGGESSKSGVAPESEELDELVRAAHGLKNLDFRGLMTVPPYREDPEEARPFFRQLRQLQDQIAQRNLPAIRMEVLSMGMSHDFEVAIEEGSTCVRVGTAIFGERTRLA